MSIFFFADAGSKDNSQDNNMGNGSYMCTEGQVNEGVYMKAFEKAGVFTGKGKILFKLLGKIILIQFFLQQLLSMKQEEVHLTL